jgi:hypothetical protein
LSATVSSLEIVDPETRKYIQAIIESESGALSSEHQISLAAIRNSDLWVLRVRRPDGSEIAKQLYGNQGEHTPVGFRMRIRELFKSL